MLARCMPSGQVRRPRRWAGPSACTCASHLVAFVVLVATMQCGSGSGGSAPPSLASTCARVCNNVLAQCGAPPASVSSCLQGCQQLNVIQGTCVDQFASYMTCLAGATSVTCTS